MDLGHIIFLLALLIPLTIDTFILSAALGLAGMKKKEQFRISLILTLFEAFMPAVGVLIGQGLGEVLGHFAGYTAAIVIGLAGYLMIKSGNDEEKEQKRMKLLAHARGIAVIDLALSISLDELAVGLSLGILNVPLPIAVIFIGLQAFIASQAGFRIGTKLNEKAREGAEKIGGIALIFVAIVIITLKLLGGQI
jgi:putative Mn2+ efflux pump MntP